MNTRLALTVGTVLLALAACKTSGVTWDYAMDASYNGAHYGCTGDAGMDISSGRIAWDGDRDHCSGAETVRDAMPKLRHERIVYDDNKGWIVDPSEGWFTTSRTFEQCSVELPNSSDTSEGVLIHCGWDCQFDACSGEAEYRILPRR